MLHLARDWAPESGGDLVFVDRPAEIVHPEFNALTVFRVGAGENWHLVSPVVDERGGSPRLAVAGWFNATTTPAAPPASAGRRVLDVDGAAG